MKHRKELWVFKQTGDFFDDYDLGERLGGGAYGKYIAITVFGFEREMSEIHL